MIELELPIPPSVNAMYANRKGGKGRGRFKTKVYKQWLRNADIYLLVQKRDLPREPITGQLLIEIRVPANLRGDITNRVKATEDFLVSRKITGDDKNNWSVLIKRDKSIGCCHIKIVPLEDS